MTDAEFQHHLNTQTGQHPTPHQHCWHHAGQTPHPYVICCHCDTATTRQHPRALQAGETHGPHAPHE